MVKPLDYEYALCPTSQFYFCSVPFRLDISPFCSMGCRYCFSLARGGKRAIANKLVDVERLRRKFETIFNNSDGVTDITSEFILHRMPIHLGGVSDPFSCEENTKRTLQILSILNRFDYPTIISSKQTERMLRDDALAILKSMKYLTIQISAPIPEDKLSKLIEPGAPVFSHRIRHIKIINDERLHVVVRLQPVIPPLLAKLISDGIPAIIQAGCHHLIMECLKIPLEKSNLFNILFDILRWDGQDYYSKRGAMIVGIDRVLPPKVAWETTIGLVECLANSGLTYGTTDHGLYHLGNTSCCCGVAEKEGFEGIFKANHTNIIRTSNSDQLLFSEVSKYWIPTKSIGRYINSNSRFTKNNSFFSHLHDKWNKPGNVNAPDAFLGVRYTGEQDVNGDCVYDKSDVRSYIPNI